jgi:hypothetical protein
MAKSLTVQFTDGSSHTYDNVPDDVTQDQANARASQEFADKRVGAAEAPSTAPAPTSGAVAPQREPSAGEMAIGGLKTAYDVVSPVVKEYPKTTALLTEAGLASLPAAAENIPVIGKAITAAKYPVRLGQAALEALNRVGLPPSAGPMPSTPTPAPTPSAPVARAPIPAGSNVIQFPGPANAPAQAVQAAENPSLMSRAAQMYRTYAPVVGENLAAAGRAVAPAVEAGARLASRAAGPASALLYSGGLNQGEDQALAQMRALQNNIGRLPKDQQTMYFNLPADKRQRVDQMILMGGNPAALLVPNAINSGFAQELKKLGR